MHSTPWIVRQSAKHPRLRLYCFCYAGGNATSFMGWQAKFDPSIEICAIQLPGRGSRFHEAPYRVLPDLIAVLSDVLRRESIVPFAFFGHSLGGLLAFELARYNMNHGLDMPQHLFISGCGAPKYRRPSAGLHQLDDDTFLDTLRGYNGTPPEILDNRELMMVVMPTIRSDFALAEGYEYRRGPLLKVPITVLAGKLDEFDSPKEVSGWQEETLNRFRVQWFDGDHFFIVSNQHEVLTCISSELNSLLVCQRYSRLSSSA
jgi:surfactin synthase thioesterase subunit